jgi:hypothetical protein
MPIADQDQRLKTDWIQSHESWFNAISQKPTVIPKISIICVLAGQPGCCRSPRSRQPFFHFSFLLHLSLIFLLFSSYCQVWSFPLSAIQRLMLVDMKWCRTSPFRHSARDFLATPPLQSRLHDSLPVRLWLPWYIPFLIIPTRNIFYILGLVNDNGFCDSDGPLFIHTVLSDTIAE